MVVYFGNDLSQINDEILNLKNIKKINYCGDNNLVFDDLSQLTLFGSYENVVISDADFLLKQSKENEKLINFLINFDIPVFCTVKSDKIDNFCSTVANNKQVKLIKKTILNAYNKSDEIKKMCQELEIKFDSNITFNILIQSLPNNFLLIKSELNKLKLYVQDSAVTKNDLSDILIENLDSNIFQLVNYLLTNNVKSSLALYKKLINSKHQPIEIIQIMSTQLMKFKFLKMALSQGSKANEISSDLGISPYQLRQMSFINKISIEKLNRILNQLFELDCNIKKEILDPFQSLEFYLVSSYL